MIKNIVIAGHGSFAKSLIMDIPKAAAEKGLSGLRVIPWGEKGSQKLSNVLVVHAGSGRELKAIFSFAKKMACPVIQASTGGITEDDSDLLGFTFIEAPNLSISMVKFLYALQEFGYLFSKDQVSITETHQSTKTTVPGTAVLMAKALGLESSLIKSVRDRKTQLEMGVPKESLDGHAVHLINLKGPGGEKISFRTEILGRSSYAYGVMEIAKVVSELDKRKYNVTDLIRDKII